MAYTQHVAHRLEIHRLKGLINLDEIRFDEKPLTAILGPNGCGKSTILHALACCYKPQDVEHPQENWRFKDFFTPTTDATWAGSHFKLIHSFREGANQFNNVIAEYRKVTQRWAPRYETRPDRHVVFIGIKTCVPTIEEETYTSLIRYVTAPHRDTALIREKMNVVFNRNYAELNIHNAHGGRSYNGLALNGTRYSSLSMGAGEQRVLHILSRVFNAPKNALILIDEIDLLLHTAALKNLIKIISERAVAKALQIIFTTHREAVLELSNIVSIKHIHTISGKTYCFSNTKPDAMERLTGVQHRPIEIFVEDVVANAVVEHELFSLNMKRSATVTKYGAATNCFTIAAGLMLKGNHDFVNHLFLLDGDLYRTEPERLNRVQQVLSGTELNAVQRRQQILGAVKMLCPSFGAVPPEVELHQMIRTLPVQQDGGANEIIQIANRIEAVDDTHSFVDQIIETLNVERAVGLSRIVEVAARSLLWNEYVQELREWLIARRPEFEEHIA